MKIVCFSCATFLLAFSSACPAAIISHSGDSSPLSQGWSRLSNSPAAGSEGGIDDAGVHAWQVSDTSITDASFSYRYQLAPTELAKAVSSGWSLSARFRIVDANDVPGGSIGLSFRTDTTAYDILIGADAGVPRLILPTDTGQEDLTLTGLGSGYHEYQLKYDPVSDSADLSVGGTTVLSNWGGADFSTGSFGLQQSVFFGANSVPDTGTVNFASVSLAAVPEPSAVVLALVCAVIAGFWRTARSNE